MGAVTTTTWVDRWGLAALVMRGVANCCGYNPGMAKALAVGYVHARRHPRAYERERDEHLSFAGLWFLDLGDDTVTIAGERFGGPRYEREVVTPMTSTIHHPLFYLACEVAEDLDFVKMDGTALVWRRLERWLGDRTSVRFAEAKGIVEGLRR